MSRIEKIYKTLDNFELKNHTQGFITAKRGALLVASIPKATIGSLCNISRAHQDDLCAQVVSFEEHSVLLSPFEDPFGVAPGSLVTLLADQAIISFTDNNSHCVIDPLGKVLHSASHSDNAENLKLRIDSTAPDPFQRDSTVSRFKTGIIGIDLLTPIGLGQRIGIFAGAGLGKSTLLSDLVSASEAEVIIVALVGERGREVLEFYEKTVRLCRSKKIIIVSATSDQSALMRSLCPLSATSIAEYFCHRGQNVLLVIDSLTRAARAIRDLSLSAGELPVRQGFTPSVYSMLPKLIERAGRFKKGSITAIYTVLTNNFADNDALSEELKSLLDGHIVLSEDIASRLIRPAIDYTVSLSRFRARIHNSFEERIANTVMGILTRVKNERDLVALGGTIDNDLKVAMEREPKLQQALSANYQNIEQLYNNINNCLGATT